jgi:hypothetical protein
VGETAIEPRKPVLCSSFQENEESLNSKIRCVAPGLLLDKRGKIREQAFELHFNVAMKKLSQTHSVEQSWLAYPAQHMAMPSPEPVAALHKVRCSCASFCARPACISLSTVLVLLVAVLTAVYWNYLVRPPPSYDLSNPFYSFSPENPFLTWHSCVLSHSFPRFSSDADSWLHQECRTCAAYVSEPPAIPRRFQEPCGRVGGGALPAQSNFQSLVFIAPAAKHCHWRLDALQPRTI